MSFYGFLSKVSTKMNKAWKELAFPFIYNTEPLQDRGSSNTEAGRNDLAGLGFLTKG